MRPGASPVFLGPPPALQRLCSDAQGCTPKIPLPTPKTRQVRLLTRGNKAEKPHLVAKAALYQVKATPRQNRAQSKLVPWRGQRHSHQLPGNEEKKGSFLPKKRRVRVPRLLFKGFSHSPSQLGKIRLGGMGVGPALPPPAHLEGGHHPQIIADSPQNTPRAAWWCHAKSPQSPASP